MAWEQTRTAHAVQARDIYPFARVEDFPHGRVREHRAQRRPDLRPQREAIDDVVLAVRRDLQQARKALKRKLRVGFHVDCDRRFRPGELRGHGLERVRRIDDLDRDLGWSVSYTHLTLPTILLV